MSYNPDGYCSNPGCICNTPGRICQKFMHYFSNYCVRCGWERADHTRKPLIHRGGRPRA